MRQLVMIMLRSIKIHAALGFALVAQQASAAPAFVAPPWISANPNTSAPLAAVLNLEPSQPVTAEVTVEESLAGKPVKSWRVTFADLEPGARKLPLLGFRPGGTSRIGLTIRTKDGQSATAPPLAYTAPPVPNVGPAWPGIEVDVREASKVDPGVTFISLRRRAPGRQAWQSPAQQRFARRWGLVLALDRAGEPIWFYRSDQRVAGVQALPDGKLLMTLQDQRTRIIDMLGNTLAEYVAELRPDRQTIPGAVPIKGVQTIHHEPYMTKTGTLISMSANARRIDDYYTSVTDPKAPRKSQLVMGDSLIEYDRGGEIVWRWDSFDHLDPSRIHYHLLQPYWAVRGFPGHLDWTHGNGLTVDEKRDTIIMSLKHMDALVGISRKSGAVKWIYGDPAGWTGALATKVLRPSGPFVRYPHSPHHPHVSRDGSIVYYDNGMFQARPFDGRAPVPQHLNFSRGVQIKVDEKAMTFTETWTSETERTSDSCYHWAMGEADQLPSSGNFMLVRAFCPPADPALDEFDEYDLSRRFVDDVPYYGRIDQYSGSTPAELVARFRIVDPDEIIQWQIYGGFHRPALYWGRPGVRFEAR
jgi:arylsulfate sulfotransferase